MGYLDLVTTQRDVERAARAFARWQRGLRRDVAGAASDAWLEPPRHVTTRAMFQAVSELDPSVPEAAGLGRWVYALALGRIAQPWIVRLAEARMAPRIRLEKPE